MIIAVLVPLFGCRDCGSSDDPGDAGIPADAFARDAVGPDDVGTNPDVALPVYCEDAIVNGESFAVALGDSVGGIAAGSGDEDDFVAIDTHRDGARSVEVWRVHRTDGRAERLMRESRPPGLPGVATLELLASNTGASVLMHDQATGDVGIFRTETHDLRWSSMAGPMAKVVLTERRADGDDLLVLREDDGGEALFERWAWPVAGDPRVFPVAGPGGSARYGAGQPSYASSAAGWRAVAFGAGGEGRVVVFDNSLSRMEAVWPFAGALAPRGALAAMGRRALGLVTQNDGVATVYRVSPEGLEPWASLPNGLSALTAAGDPAGMVVLSNTVSADGTVVDPEAVTSDGQILAGELSDLAPGWVRPPQPILSGRCWSADLALPSVGGWVLASDCLPEQGMVRTTRYCVPDGER